MYNKRLCSFPITFLCIKRFDWFRQTITYKTCNFFRLTPILFFQPGKCETCTRQIPHIYRKCNIFRKFLYTKLILKLRLHFENRVRSNVIQNAVLDTSQFFTISFTPIFTKAFLVNISSIESASIVFASVLITLSRPFCLSAVVHSYLLPYYFTYFILKSPIVKNDTLPLFIDYIYISVICFRQK